MVIVISSRLPSNRFPLVLRVLLGDSTARVTKLFKLSTVLPLPVLVLRKWDPPRNDP